MSDYISQFEIEQMSEQQLRAKFHEIFNAIALKQQTTQDCEMLRTNLYRVQRELYKRVYLKKD